MFAVLSDMHRKISILSSLIVTIGTSICPLLSQAGERVDLFCYLDEDEVEITLGSYLCEPVDSTGEIQDYFYINDFSRTLTPENDAAGALVLGRAGRRQETFAAVTLNQLITSVTPEGRQSSQAFDFYLKLHWRGTAPGVAGAELSNSHIIKGSAIRDEDSGLLQVRVDTVPDLYLLSMFMPELDIAMMFGRNAHTEADQLEMEIKLWVDLLVEPALSAYFNRQEHELQLR